MAHQHLLIYYWAKLLTVRSSSRADVSLETHCNKMNCHCFLAELYKLPHQSHNMGPPPLAINQWESRRRHKMPFRSPELRRASGWQALLFPCFTWSSFSFFSPSSVVEVETSEFTYCNWMSSYSVLVKWQISGSGLSGSRCQSLTCESKTKDTE